jgi:hypothetical protein
MLLLLCCSARNTSIDAASQARPGHSRARTRSDLVIRLGVIQKTFGRPLPSSSRSSMRTITTEERQIQRAVDLLTEKWDEAVHTILDRLVGD